jgi:hypothetical protein
MLWWSSFLYILGGGPASAPLEPITEKVIAILGNYNASVIGFDGIDTLGDSSPEW